MKGCDNVIYKKYIISKLFDIHPTKAYKYTNKELFSERGTVPVVTNTSENHGRSGFSVLSPTEHDIITFSDTGTKSPDSFFYQEGEFIGYSHVQGMYPYSDKWSKNSLLYICALLRKKTQGLYDYSTKMTRDIILNMEVDIPVTDNGDIDFSYMEQSIADLENTGNRHISDIMTEEGLKDTALSVIEKIAYTNYKNDKVVFKKIRAKELFCVKGNPQLNKDSFVFSKSADYPYFTRTIFNNGILGYVDYLDDEHLIKGNSIAVGMMGMKFFYMEHDFYAGQFTKTLFPLFDGFDELIALYFIALLNKHSQKYLGGLVRDFEKLLYDTELQVPMKNDEIDFEFIRNFILVQKKMVASLIK